MDFTSLLEAYQAGAISTREVVRRLEGGQTCPLSEGQKGLWALHKLEPESSAYNVPICISCDRPLDLNKLKIALHNVIEQHPLLAMRVRHGDGQPRLVDASREGLRLAYANIEHLEEGDLQSYLTRLARLPFDLERDPLVRFDVLGRGKNETLLLIVAHHVILDGKSSWLLVDSLLKAYDDLAAGRRPSMEKQPAAEYAAFVTWQQSAMEGARGLIDGRYWKQQLEGVTPIVGMPLTRSGAAREVSEGEIQSLALTPGRLAAVEHWVRKHEVSKGAFFLAVFKLLLHRYTGMQDIVVGMPIMVRPEERFDRVIGHFINMTPIRSRLSGGDEFPAYVKRLQSIVFDAIDHSAYPFTRMVRDLAKGDRGGASPIFQISYNYQDFSGAGTIAALQKDVESGLRFHVVQGLYQAGEYAFGLDVLPEQGMLLNFKYDPKLYSADTISRMRDHYANLIAAITEEKPAAMGQLAMLGAEELDALLKLDDGAARLFAEDICCIKLFAEQAALRPEAPAATFQDTTLTYGQLDALSDRLASRLRQAGVEKGARVGVYVERSIEMLSALLAVMKCGAAYAPMEPGCPAARLSHMISNSNCRLILTQRALASALPRLDLQRITVMLLDDGGTDGAPSPPFACADGAGPLAYIMYTSGSTGQPKGVMVPQKALTNFLLSMKETLGCGPRDRLLALTTYCFDIAALELYLPLICGAHCIICESSVARDAELLRQEIARRRPTLMQATPVTWSMLFRVGWTNAERVRILCGGEALPDNLKRLFLDNGCDVWNMYGPTETTIWSTMGRVVDGGPITVGKPIANTRAYIVDANLRLAPLGVVGELCIAGDGVALGYCENPERTAERFIESPFRSGEKLYRTGDLARRLVNGEIELVGRMDDQVKVHGFRIELAEIVNALNRHPEVETSVVLVRGENPDLRLVAYITRKARQWDAEPSRGMGNLDPRSLRSFLKKNLPDYMIPGEFNLVEAFPLTLNGKIDRRRLLQSSAAPVVSFGQGTELALTRQIELIFREQLKHENFSREDRFFEIGGDSFTAIAVIEKINQAFSCNIGVTLLFKHPSVSELSEAVHAMLAPGQATSANYTEKSSEQSVRPGRRHAKGSARRPELPEYYRKSLAIVGISCQFPGASDHREFWSNLIGGKESVRLVPRRELSEAGVPVAILDNKNYVPQQASINARDEFDSFFFAISPRDAAFMDPQARLLLQNAWLAVEDAGYNVEDIPGAAVYMSTGNNYYQAQLPGLVPKGDQPRIMHNASEYVAWILAQGGSIPTMISNKLGFTGPSVYVSTNCSSSLTGLYLACQGLLAGEADQALVGAAAVFPAAGFGYVHQPGLNFSGDGRCKAFDASADGMAGGEGAAVIMVKRAEDAIDCGDNIYALIRSVAANNDGAAKAGFYAPSVQGQTDVIRRAIDKAGVDPETIGYVEAHGAGTRLGDPIEFMALTEAYRKYTSRWRFCALGSVKTNIGHLDCAAGLAGLIKAALSLHHGVIPATLNYRSPNPELDIAHSPFYIATETRAFSDLEGDEPPRAAVSSFGIGGSNAHAILEQVQREPRARESVEDSPPPFLILLSAQNRGRLRARAEALLQFIPSYRSEAGSLAAMAYTLQVGRRPMASRLALVVASFEALEAALSAYVSDSPLPSGCFAGDWEDRGTSEQAPPACDADRLADWFDAGELHKAAQAWVGGSQVDWRRRHAGSRLKRVSLPGYVFARKRHRIQPETGCAVPAAPAADDDDARSNTLKRKTGSGGQPDLHGENILKEETRESSCRVCSGSNRAAPASGDSRRSSGLAKKVEDAIVDTMLATLKMERDEIANDVALSTYGLDSLAAVQLVEQLNRRLQVDLQVISLFDYPSVAKLADYILDAFADALADEARLPASSTPAGAGAPLRVEQAPMDAAPPGGDAIAIIGMSGRFPQCDDIEEFWRSLARGDDLVEPVTRWDLTPYRSGCRAGGFLRDISHFDPLFFNISGIEAAYMEPQQRVFLEESWKALEDAGYAGADMDRQRCGVYVGCAAGDYFDLVTSEDYPAQALWGNMSSLVPARISYYLNLHGPALAIDTACSSSLAAIHLACQALRDRGVDMAIAGGVYIQCTPRLYIAGERAGMLSQSGRCRTFDNSADGFAPAEGVGALALKRLNDALASGDQIHGVIRGSGLNQDGATNGITAPSANSQQRLEQQIYEDFGVDCGDIQMVEAHGTGTRLGDPIEFQALTQAFRSMTDKQAYCALGSSKSNLGHAQMAAGVIGVIKILMALKNKKIPPSLHFKTLNTNISLEGSPFYINTELRDWRCEPGKPRRAAISSFGASGTNAHMVIEEAPSFERSASSRSEWLICLSARTDEQLRSLAERLAAHCERHGDIDIGDVSFTLLMGRRLFSRRLALVTGGVEELGRKLRQWLVEGVEPPGVFVRSRSKEKTEAGGGGLAAAADQTLADLARQFASGATLDARSLFAGAGRRRVSLPTYPFERLHCWLPDGEIPKTRPGDGVKSADESQLRLSPGGDEGSTNSFTTKLTGAEFFLSDHKIQGRSILPGAVYLELAHAALRLARRSETRGQIAVTLKDVVLLRPVEVGDRPVQIHIELDAETQALFEIYSEGDGSDRQTHCRGEIGFEPTAAGASLDLSGLLQQRQWKSVDPAQFYTDFDALGICYGSRFRGVSQINVAGGAVLTRIVAPDAVKSTLGQFSLHPVLIDSALQCLRLASADEGGGKRARVLFAIKEARFVAPCTAVMWAWLRSSGEGANGASATTIDIDLADENGKICVVLKGVATRPVSAAPEPVTAPVTSARPVAMNLLPFWDFTASAGGERWPESNCAMAVVGGSRQALEALRHNYPGAQAIDAPAGCGVDELVRKLQAIAPLDHLIWIGPEAAPKLPAADDLISGQHRGTIQIFHLLKALLATGHGDRSFGWTFITQGAQSIHDGERSDPTHAGVGGLVGSMAKEHPNWRIRSADVADFEAKSLQAVLSLRPDADGATFCCRRGRWFEQRLTPCEGLSGLSGRFRLNAVYVIAGGAGGLGRAISEYLIRRYRAQIVWLGRRARSAAVDASIEALAAIGPAPVYLQADAADGGSLRQAHAEIGRRFGPVHGLIQSAMVLGAASLDRMTEDVFQAVLRSKVDVCARLVEEFNSEKLELALFLSSLNSYLKAMGQGNYSAACTFKDGFARRLAQDVPAAVKVINLSYCFNNIDASQHLSQEKIDDFISLDELMTAMEALAASDLPQMTLLKHPVSFNMRGVTLSDEAASARLGDDVSYLESLKKNAAGNVETGVLGRIRERMKSLNALVIS